MTVEHIPALQINVPELYADPVFAAWVNRVVRKRLGLATWHTGGEMHEHSDVFVTYDHGEGSDNPDNPAGMPEQCWAKLCEIVKAQGLDYCLLWLTNIGE